MQAIYHANVDELTIEFITMLKREFAHAKVDIVINQSDDTDYLNSSQYNKKLLEEAIKEVSSTKLIQKTEHELGI